MGKAASTTIQRSILTDPSCPVSIGRHNHHESVENGLEKFWWRGLYSPYSSINKDAKHKLLNSYLRTNDCVILSDEVISSSPIIIKNLIQNIADMDIKVKILFIIRNQLKLLPSLFNHSMRSRIIGFGIPRLHTEMISNMKYGGDINQWVEDLLIAHGLGDENIINNLFYDDLVKQLVSVTGKDSVTVLPMELIVDTPEIFADVLAKLFHMKTDQVNSQMKKKSNITGERLRDYKFGNLINTLINNKNFNMFNFLKNIGISRKIIIRYVVQILNIMKLRQTSNINDITKLHIMKKFNKSNSNLNNLLTYDLGKMGYPLEND